MLFFELPCSFNSMQSIFILKFYFLKVFYVYFESLNKSEEIS